jgi:hypothetical protein
MTALLSADDFNEVGPARHRSTGAPTYTLQGERFSDIFRYNRVEGAFTGLGVTARLRDAMPGATLRAVGGYAWNERVARGRVSAELQRGGWTYALRAGRSLDITNDFKTGIDSGSSLGPLIGLDDFDYVDRYSAGAAVTRIYGRREALLRVEAGWAADHAVSDRIERSPIFRSAFLDNRGIDEGSYLRTAVTLEWHPSHLDEDVDRPGFGASLSYLGGSGGLNFQRVEFSVRGVRNTGQWRFGTRLETGAAFGTVPPQQLFEAGNDNDLPSYDYKAFAGDRAALLRGFIEYRFKFLNGPMFASRGLVIPGVSPALFTSIGGGWLGTSNDATRAAIERLGTHIVTDSLSVQRIAPVSVPLSRPVGSFGAGVTFFGGAIGIGMARSLERLAQWQVLLVAGLYF